MRPGILGIAWAGFLGTLLALPATAQPPIYHAEYLGAATGAAAINEAGQIVGSALIGGTTHGWVAASGMPLSPLPLPSGMASSFANDINNLGVIVGAVSAASSPEFEAQAARWTPDGNGGYAIELLGLLPGHVQSNATGINDPGDVVGVSGDGTYRYPVLFTAPGGVQDLSASGVFDPADVNNARVLVDNSFTVKLLDLNTMAVQDLGVPGGGGWLATRSNAINENGQVAGIAIRSSGYPCDFYAARFTPGAGWEVMSACGRNNSATDLNDLGDVVMRLNTDVWVRFDDLGSYRLQDLISTEQGQWYVVNGFGNAINNARQIATFATNDNTGQGGLVLLTAETLAASVESPIAGPRNGALRILECVPNPLGEASEIRLRLPPGASASPAILQVLDVTGRTVRTLLTGPIMAGVHTVAWDAEDDSGARLPGGVYCFRLRIGDTVETRRAVYVR